MLNHAAMTSGLLDAAKAKNHRHPRGGAVRGQRPRDGRDAASSGRCTATGTALPEVVEAVGKMQARAEELGVTMAQAALQYAVTKPKMRLCRGLGVTKP